MKLVVVLAACSIAAGADRRLYGTWRMRPIEGRPSAVKSQTIRIEQTAGGSKVSYEIGLVNGKGVDLYYVTKLDGAPVPVISQGRSVGTVRVREIGPTAFEWQSEPATMVGNSRLTLGADGNTLSIQTVMSAGQSRSSAVYDRVK